MGTLLGHARRRVPGDDPLTEQLDHVRTIAQETLDRIRAQSQWLHPGVLDDFGLEKALARCAEQFERQTGIRTTLEATGPIGDVRPEFAIHVYRVVQEALSNIGRHSGSSEARVQLECDGAALRAEVEDRGRGMAAGRARTVEGGLGLVSMRERAELMGGQLRLRQSPGGGLIVEMRVPRAIVTTTPEGVLT